MADTGIIKSQGTKLWFVDPITSLAQSVTCVTSISGLGGARDQIDTTCLDNTEDRTYEGGLGNPGQVQAGYNLHKGDASQDALFDMKDSGEATNWLILASGAIGAPTVDSNGVLVPPAGAIGLGFTGYVSDVTVDIAMNDIWKGQITIQRSGSITRHLGV